MDKKQRAIVATDNIYHSEFAKTAHGLVRGTDRFEIIAIIDSKYFGNDAGQLLDGKHRNIPIYSSIKESLEKESNIETLVIGVATAGGVLSENLLNVVKDGIRSGLSIVNGLHDLLNERKEIKELAEKYKVVLTDIRKPKSINQLHFWTSEIYKVDVPIVAIIGIDCAMGKRTTARLLTETCNNNKLKAEMIYTGQTGWMQGSKYGFIFDSTINDFVSGELEHAIVNCWKNESPDIIFIEGQSGLRNPSGPCGTELLISGNAKHVVLIHEPARIYFDNIESWGKIPSIESEINLIESYGSKVIAIAINKHGLNNEEAREIKNQYVDKFQIPILFPIENGVNELIPILQQLTK